MTASRFAWHLTASLLAVAPAAAQRLEIRGLARPVDLQLDASLGINPDSLRSTGRGVLYIDIQPGTGAPVATGDILQVHYVGFLADGTRFAATDRNPFTFRVGEGRVIAGWEDGVVGMREGGRRQLVIPAYLAYGREGNGKIPPDATLVFDITVVQRTR